MGLLTALQPKRDKSGSYAELNLVKIAIARYGQAELAKTTLYTSTEPCAMCAGAIYWSGIGKVSFALSEEALYALTSAQVARDAMKIPCRDVFAQCGRPVEVEGPTLEEEAKAPHIGFWE